MTLSWSDLPSNMANTVRTQDTDKVAKVCKSNKWLFPFIPTSDRGNSDR